MKLIYINKDTEKYPKWKVTYGKSYEIYNALRYKDQYTILDDNNTIGWVFMTDFMTIDEWREIQLNEIGI